MISRFFKLFVAIVVLLLLITTLTLVNDSPRSYIDPWTGKLFQGSQSNADPNANAKPNIGPGTGTGTDEAIKNAPDNPSVKLGNGGKIVEFEEDEPIAGGIGVGVGGGKGEVIMSKLGNATAKAELGRATWKLLHTMTLRYPETPTQDERNALSSYLHLTSRLYPCGECAAEFQALLKAYPPQTSSRKNAALWLCFIHNQVNARLEKEEFDCAHLDATYDCGCGDEPIGGVVADPKGTIEDPMDLEEDIGALMKGG